MRFHLPGSLMVLTLATLTPKISSTAFFDLYLAGIDRYFEGVLVVLCAHHGTLGDDRLLIMSYAYFIMRIPPAASQLLPCR